ncbi:MAG: hypothetical protein KBS41_03820 [Oscillospiraceae bacterium]|nr:hypothetical protein [Candidatus Equicaccousia limihippi]
MKNKTRGLVVLLLAFVVLTTVLFVIPTEKASAFWISYGFTVFAFVAQVLIWNIGFKNGESLKSKFLGIPIVHIGTIYLIVQSLSTVLFGILRVENWVSTVISVLILGISAVLMISSQTARDEINRVENKVKEKVDFIRLIQCDVELLANAEKDENTKKALEDLAEKIRFSDPMSNEQLKSVEDKIKEKIEELKDANSKTAVIGEIDSLLAKRNSKAKALK